MSGSGSSIQLLEWRFDRFASLTKQLIGALEELIIIPVVSGPSRVLILADWLWTR